MTISVVSSRGFEKSSNNTTKKIVYENNLLQSK